MQCKTVTVLFDDKCDNFTNSIIVRQFLFLCISHLNIVRMEMGSEPEALVIGLR